MKPPLIIVHQEITQGQHKENDPQVDLPAFVGLLWDKEMKRFQDATGYVINPEDDLQDWITKCEEEQLTDHLFYHLMVLMLDYLSKQP